MLRKQRFYIGVDDAAGKLIVAQDSVFDAARLSRSAQKETPATPPRGRRNPRGGEIAAPRPFRRERSGVKRQATATLMSAGAAGAPEGQPPIAPTPLRSRYAAEQLAVDPLDPGLMLLLGGPKVPFKGDLDRLFAGDQRQPDESQGLRARFQIFGQQTQRRRREPVGEIEVDEASTPPDDSAVRHESRRLYDGVDLREIVVVTKHRYLFMRERELREPQGDRQLCAKGESIMPIKSRRSLGFHRKSGDFLVASRL